MAGVNVTIGANAAGAFNALNQVQGRALSVAQKIATGFQERIGHKLFDGLIRAAASLPNAMKAAIDAGGRLSDQMARTGAAGEKLVVLERALKNAGMSAERTTVLINQMQRSIAGLNEENQSTAAAFARLGLNMEELRNMDPVDALQRIGQAIAGIQDPAERTAVAMRIFGRAGTEATVLFSERGAFEKARQQLGALPAVLAENASKMDAVSDRLGNMGTAWQQIGTAAAVAVLPALEKITASLESMDLTGVGDAIGRLLNLMVTLAPAIATVGIAFIGLKMSAFIASLVASTAAWWAKTAAINANTAALGANTVASAGAARGMALMTLAGGPLGIILLAVGAAFMAFQRWVGATNDQLDRLEKNLNAGNAAIRRFDIATIRGQAASREEIEETVKAIEDEIQAIKELGVEAENAAEKQKDKDAINQQTAVTVQILQTQIAALRRVTDEQLDANAATRAAAQAQEELAAKVEESAKRYAELRAQLEKTMQSEGFALTGKGDPKEQLRELDAMTAKIRESLSAGRGQSVDQLIENIDAREDSPERTKDLELAIKLREMEEKRGDLVARVADEEARIRQSKAEAFASWQEELGILRAQIEGQTSKTAALEREAEVRREIARLVSAGFDADQAAVGAEKLVAAREEAQLAAEAAEAEERRSEARERGKDIARDALALTGGAETSAEREIEKRAQEIAEQSGLGQREARSIAESEADLQKLTALSGGGNGFESTIGKVSSMQSIGGGGGVVSSGIDIARQQADTQKQMLAVLNRILDRTPGTISDL